MTIDHQQQAGVHILKLDGQLGDPEALELVDAVSGVLTGPGAKVVLDLANVPYVNSSGLGGLVRTVAQANLQEQRVVLARPSSFFTGLLSVTHLDRFFEVFPTIEDAIQAIR